MWSWSLLRQCILIFKCLKLQPGTIYMLWPHCIVYTPWYLSNNSRKVNERDFPNSKTLQIKNALKPVICKYRSGILCTLTVVANEEQSLDWKRNERYHNTIKWHNSGYLQELPFKGGLRSSEIVWAAYFSTLLSPRSATFKCPDSSSKMFLIQIITNSSFLFDVYFWSIKPQDTS